MRNVLDFVIAGVIIYHLLLSVIIVFVLRKINKLSRAIQDSRYTATHKAKSNHGTSPHLESSYTTYHGSPYMATRDSGEKSTAGDEDPIVPLESRNDYCQGETDISRRSGNFGLAVTTLNPSGYIVCEGTTRFVTLLQGTIALPGDEITIDKVERGR